MDSENSWVTSAGGPLILIPESVCQQWVGAPCTYPDDQGDYGRTCEVDGYVGLIDVGGTQALVLGDTPARTTFPRQHNIMIRPRLEGTRSPDALHRHRPHLRLAGQCCGPAG
ncbi:Imm21 family immunity protein [Streptomyces sp. NPDC059215]|uniref:Imm21 family immunity protein n=1 Tax=Streptomyces sp. NPDC059215 TaxID=3346772 RepID=UPI0036C5ABE8